MKHYDAIIIGSGQGGTPLAKKLASEGWKTALIEKQYVGGTCVNVGCTPTKTMIASAKVAYLAAGANKFGVKTQHEGVDMHKVIARKNEIVASSRNGGRKGLEQTENLDLIFGTASFSGKKEISVALNEGGETTLAANYFFIDTGTRPAIPDIEGLESARYLTSTTIMDLEEIPSHLLIIGGGYIGLEFGQMYRRFGSKVTILEHNSRFLPKEDEDIAGEICSILQEEGIKIFTSANVVAVRGTTPNIKVTAKVKEAENSITCSHILVAAGRLPNTDDLNLELAGVSVDKRGFIKVDDRLCTTAENIYAIGDVNGGPQFTHISYDDYRILYHNLVHNGQLTTTNRLVPYTMFTDPQLGSIGITEEQAKKDGLAIKIATLPMSHVARASETGDTRGLMKAVVDAEKGTILGAAILGQEGGELMSMLQIAMMGNVTASQLKDTIFAHPLYAESLNNLFKSF